MREDLALPGGRGRGGARGKPRGGPGRLGAGRELQEAVRASAPVSAGAGPSDRPRPLLGRSRPPDGGRRSPERGGRAAGRRRAERARPTVAARRAPAAGRAAAGGRPAWHSARPTASSSTARSSPARPPEPRARRSRSRAAHPRRPRRRGAGPPQRHRRGPGEPAGPLRPRGRDRRVEPRPGRMAPAPERPGGRSRIALDPRAHRGPGPRRRRPAAGLPGGLDPGPHHRRGRERQRPLGVPGGLDGEARPARGGARPAGRRPERSAYAYDLRALAGWSSNLATNRLLRRFGVGAAADGLRRLDARRSTFPGEYIVGTELQPGLPAPGAGASPRASRGG